MAHFKTFCGCSLKSGVKVVALLEFLARLIFLIIFISMIPPAEPSLDYLKEMEMSVEDLQTARPIFIFSACLFSVEVLLPPLFLVLGAVSKSRQTLSMWIGYKVISVIREVMTIIFLFVTSGLGFIRGGVGLMKFVIALYYLINLMYFKVVTSHIEEIKQKKASVNNKNNTSSDLPYPILADAYPVQPGAYPVQPGVYPVQAGAYPVQANAPLV